MSQFYSLCVPHNLRWWQRFRQRPNSINRHWTHRPDNDLENYESEKFYFVSNSRQALFELLVPEHCHQTHQPDNELENYESEKFYYDYISLQAPLFLKKATIQTHPSTLASNSSTTLRLGRRTGCSRRRRAGLTLRGPWFITRCLFRC